MRLRQSSDEPGFPYYLKGRLPDSNIATADALTLLLHNQHALGAAIEEVTKWLAEHGAGAVAENAVVAMETLDKNAKAISEVILRLRES